MSHQVALDRTNCRGKSEPRAIPLNAACCLLLLHGSVSYSVECSRKKISVVEHLRSARPMKQLMTAGGGVSLANYRSNLKSIAQKQSCDSAAVCYFRTVSL